MLLKVSLGSYSERQIAHVLSLGFKKRPLSPSRVLGYFSIVAPSSPVANGMGSREIVIGKSMFLRRFVFLLNLPQIKVESPIRHNNPGIPTPIVNPYLALLERPASNI